ncbi:MAG: efflux RND transporter permease subunit [Bacilli bacterium]
MKMIFNLQRLFFLITIFLISIGVYSFAKIPKQENPDLGSLYTEIKIEAPGLSSVEIDNEIITEINSKISMIDEVGNVVSNVYENYGIIIVTYKIEIDDVSSVETKLNNAVSSLTFAENIKVKVTPYSGVSDILYTFNEDDLNKANELKNRLYSIDAISRITISDYNLSSYKVDLDNNKIAQYKMTSDDIAKLLASKGISTTLGTINNNIISTKNNFSNIDQLKNLIIGEFENKVITLDMVSEIYLDESKPYVNKYNDNNSLFLSIQFNKNVDITDTGDEIKSIVNDYPSFKIISFSPDYVDQAINEINTTLLIGMILVVLISVLSLGFRSALTIVVTFPLTIFTTIFALYLLKIPLQNVSIAGLIISIGIIVDNAIVVVDSIIHELELGNKMNQSIERTIKKNIFPIFTSTLTTIVAFTPLLFLPGVAGKMASSLPITVIIALTCSFFSSIFIIPIIGAKLLKKRNKKRIGFLDNLIKYGLKFPIVNIISVFILLITSVGLVYLYQPVQLFPNAEKEYIYIDFKVLNTNDLDKVAKVGDTIKESIENENVVTSINYTMPSIYSSLVPNFASPNSGRILYINKSDNDKEISRVKSELENKLDENVVFNVSQIMMNAPGAPIQIILYDTNKTKQIYDKLVKIDGVDNIQTSNSINNDQYNIDLNDQYLIDNSINEALVYKEISRLLNNKDIGLIEKKGVNNSIIISNNISNIEMLKKQDIIINNKKYNLKDLININTTTMPLSVSRYNYLKSDTIDVYIDSDHSVYDVQNSITKTLDKDKTNYNITGEQELTRTVFTNVVYAGVAALLLIFLILIAQFNSFKKVCIILTSIICSLIGSAIFIMIFDQPITFTATLGIVSLMGIVVNNGILLVDYIDKSAENTIYKKCYNAVKRRSRPIITSNITTIIGLIPLIITGSDFFRPMAITLVGGLIIAIPLSLCVIPSLYIVMYKDVNKK